ncbi:Uncharacterised protein [Mycobacteroides abscessus subsp. abscessus]|nr:Uncharacterised protein [Mycobacteroides abscessus subsp. abscessus]
MGSSQVSPPGRIRISWLPKLNSSIDKSGCMVTPPIVFTGFLSAPTVITSIGATPFLKYLPEFSSAIKYPASQSDIVSKT